MNLNKPEPILLGAKKIKIDGFTFYQEKAKQNPFFMMMLLICCDPTEKQKELLDEFEIQLLDDEGKVFYPREEETLKEKKRYDKSL